MALNFAILNDRSVLAFFSARTLSLVGNAMAPVALAFAVLEMPGGTATTLGLVLTARAAAQVIFVLIGGVIADRFPRHRVMVAADVAAGIAQTAVAMLVITGRADLGLLAALAVVSGAATALFTPASRSVMPLLVSGDLLQAANGLLQLSVRGGSIVGAALAGVLVSIIGAGPTLLIDAATFFVSAILLALVRLRNPIAQVPSGTVLKMLRSGWKEFVSRRWVWVMVAQLSFVNILLAGSFFVLGPVVAQRSLGGAPAWGAILTAQSIGFIAGSAVAARFRPRRPVQTAALLTAGFALPVFALGTTLPVVIIAAAAFVAGACIDLYRVVFDTALQKRIPPESLSRVMSYESVGSMALVPVGSAIAGPVAAGLGTEAALIGAALLIVVAGPVVLLIRDVRRVEEVKEPSPEPATKAP